jgi:hypothetical protein
MMAGAAVLVAGCADGEQAASAPGTVAVLGTVQMQAVTTPTAGRVYTVRASDTLASIAAETGVTVQAIIAANPGIDPAALAVGRDLVIPAPDAAAGPSATPAPRAAAPDCPLVPRAEAEAILGVQVGRNGLLSDRRDQDTDTTPVAGGPATYRAIDCLYFDTETNWLSVDLSGAVGVLASGARADAEAAWAAIPNDDHIDALEDVAGRAAWLPYAGDGSHKEHLLIAWRGDNVISIHTTAECLYQRTCDPSVDVDTRSLDVALRLARIALMRADALTP